MSSLPAALYVVATPIGNLDDITRRAIDTLRQVDLIAAEDTRQAKRLLGHLGIRQAVVSLYEHNEEGMCKELTARMAVGEAIALISDAGTPLISDPGYKLVKAAREAEVRVVPIPGVSAVITALSAAGMPTDCFHFAGFLPSKRGQRQRKLAEMRENSGTLVFYESCHRIVESVADIAEVLGEDRPMCVARELTKMYEQIRSGSAVELAEAVASGEIPSKGEFVVLVAGKPEAVVGVGTIHGWLDALLPELPLKKAAKVIAQMSDWSKSDIYQLGLDRQKEE